MSEYLKKTCLYCKMNFRPPPLIKTPRLLVFEKTSDPQTIKIPTCIKHLRKFSVLQVLHHSSYNRKVVHHEGYMIKITCF